MTPENKFIQSLTLMLGVKFSATDRRKLKVIALQYKVDASKAPDDHLPYLTDSMRDTLALSVCVRYEITQQQLTRRYHRKAPTVVVDARKELTKLIKAGYRTQLTKLGDYFGGMHHSTILYYYHGYKLPNSSRNW